MNLCTLDNCGTFWDSLMILGWYVGQVKRCRLYLEYRELCEQSRIMVCSICISINMHRERSQIKLGKPFLLKGNFVSLQSGQEYIIEMAMLNAPRAITLKEGKPELRFMRSARRLMVFYICASWKYLGRFQSYGADTNDRSADWRTDGHSKFRTV